MKVDMPPFNRQSASSMRRASPTM